MGYIVGMKRLLLAFALLYSSATYAGVGDVYYCVTDNLSDVTESGNEQYNDQKFKFKWTETEIIYSGGYLDGSREPITKAFSSEDSLEESFHTMEKFGTWLILSTSQYKNGKLTRMSFLPPEKARDGGARVIIATCDKF